jgi:L-glyceraldehyde 3-phosphate reductase
LAQGLLTNRYLDGIPEGSRATKGVGFLTKAMVTEKILDKIRGLNAIALERGQTLAQMAIAWCLAVGKVTSVLVGASRVSQIEDSVLSLNNLEFSPEEIAAIDAILDA